MTVPTYDDDLASPARCHCQRTITHGPCKTQGRPCPFDGRDYRPRVERDDARPAVTED